MEIIHYGLGIPWWGTIGVIGISVRLALMPFLVHNMKYINTGINTGPIVRLITDEFKRKQSNNEFKGTKDEKEFFTSLYNEVTNLTGFRAWKVALYPMALIFTIFPFTFAARSIVRRPNHDLGTGGLFWFTDLSSPDMHLILPFVAVSMSVIMVCYKSGKMLDSGTNINKFHLYLRNGLYLLTCWYIITLPLVVTLPCGVFCYWIPFAGIGILSKMCLFNLNIRSKLGLPAPLQRMNEPLDPILNKYFWQLNKKFKRITKKPSQKQLTSNDDNINIKDKYNFDSIKPKSRDKSKPFFDVFKVLRK